MSSLLYLAIGTPSAVRNWLCDNNTTRNAPHRAHNRPRRNRCKCAGWSPNKKRRNDQSRKAGVPCTSGCPPSPSPSAGSCAAWPGAWLQKTRAAKGKGRGRDGGEMGKRAPPRQIHTKYVGRWAKFAPGQLTVCRLNNGLSAYLSRKANKDNHMFRVPFSLKEAIVNIKRKRNKHRAQDLAQI